MMTLRFRSFPSHLLQTIRGVKSIPRPQPIRQCIQRLTETVKSSTGPNLSDSLSAIEILRDLAQLQQERFVIPVQFFHHGFKVAAAARESEVLLSLARMVSQQREDASLRKKTLIAGLKHIISHNLYEDACAVWMEGQRALVFSHSETKEVTSFLHGRHLKFSDVQPSSTVDTTTSNPNHISVSSPSASVASVAVEEPSLQAACQSYLNLAERLVDAQQHSNPNQLGRLPERDSLLDEATDSLLHLLSRRNSDGTVDPSLLDTLASVDFRARARAHLCLLTRADQFNEALLCLNRLLGVYSWPASSPPGSGYSELSSLLRAIVRDNVEVESYLQDNERAYDTNPQSWVYSLLCRIVHDSGYIYPYHGRHTKNKSDILEEIKENALQALQVLEKGGLQVDARLLHAFLRACKIRLDVERTNEPKIEDEQKTFGPFTREVREWISWLPEGKMQSSLLHELFTILLTKPTSYTINSAVYLLEWSTSSQSVEVPGETIAWVCQQVAEHGTKEKILRLSKQISHCFSPEELDYKDKKEQYLILSAQFALHKALENRLDMLNVLRSGLRLPGYNISRDLFQETIQALCTTPSGTLSKQQDLRRVFEEIGTVVDWFHGHMVTRSTFSCTEAVDALLPLFRHAIHLNDEEKRTEGVEKSLASLEDYLRRNWSAKDQEDHLHDQVLHTVVDCYCLAGKREEGLKKLIAIQEAHPNKPLLTAHSLLPYLQDMMKTGEIAEVEVVVSTYLLNPGKTLNRGVADCLVSGVMYREDYRDALDLVVDIYHQHGVTVSFKLLASMLYHWKRKMDSYEEKRVKDVATLFYGERWVRNAIQGYRDQPEEEGFEV
eukprot:scaffold1036_cov169-Ochromonas_danica.AAC.33